MTDISPCSLRVGRTVISTFGFEFIVCESGDLSLQCRTLMTMAAIRTGGSSPNVNSDKFLCAADTTLKAVDEI